MLNRLFENKRLVIYGGGNVAKEFFSKYNKTLKLKACTDTWGDAVIEGLDSIPMDQLSKDNDYLIICSGYYDEIRKKLVSIGWDPIDNFMKWDLFEQVIKSGDQKLIVGVGQCEIDEILKVLYFDNNYSSRFVFAYYSERNVCSSDVMFEAGCAKECMRIMKNADFFIRPSVLSPALKRDYGILADNMKEGAKNIVVSLFHFDSYWPQDIAKTREGSPLYMTRRNEKIGAYCERDQVMEQLVFEGLSEQDILTRISKEDFFDKDLVVENHKNNLRRIRLMDRLSDVKISDYIETNYRKKKLFCDRGHFSIDLLKEYVYRVAKVIGVELNERSVEEYDYKSIFDFVNEIPIYPGTANILGLEFVDDNTTYHMGSFGGWIEATFSEYMTHMADYYKHVYYIISHC